MNLNNKGKNNDISEFEEKKLRDLMETKAVGKVSAFGVPSALEEALKQQEQLAVKMDYCYNNPVALETQRIEQIIGSVAMKEQSAILPSIIESNNYCQIQEMAKVAGENAALWNSTATQMAQAALNCIEPLKLGFKDALINQASNIVQAQQELNSMLSMTAVQSINEMAIATANLVNTIPDFLRVGELFTATFIPPVIEEIQRINLSPIFDSLDVFRPLVDFPKISELEYRYYKRSVTRALFEARWFPEADPCLLLKIQKALGPSMPTRKGKKWIGQVNNIIFKYYTKTRIENLRKTWRTCGIPCHTVRILNQAVYAYYRGEYALTVSAMVTLWESFIANKANVSDDSKVSSKMKKSMAELVKENGCDTIISTFANEYVFYPCYNKDEVIPDVPGRHATAHSWNSGYPSKKAALNAILFTNFLLKLRSLPDIKEEAC